ncbi:fimbrial biogenesis chaperone [Metapseudomonas resinovorans]|uniref:fimbrial biogenesis chaperone n=3 Tax=Pseudomonadaceae TaxID=135621 RepID=UPI0003FED85B|nr:molecular chaperone [Pseudomonas resinovorans]MDE3737020.1 molecular chaperone [Pseudomonas resinovorans]
MLRRTISACLGALSLVLASQTFAGISLSSTRIILNSADKEASVTVRNGGQDVLVQSWIDSANDTDAPPPFAVTPPLARLPANEQQLLRVLFEGSGMPGDRESVVWLNVQEIPQATAAENTLQLAVRQRIKVFFRPAGLNGEASQAPEQLQWQLVSRAGKTELKVRNPGNYHVSMSDVKLGSDVAVESVMVAPGDEKTFSIPRPISSGSVELSFSSINDYGAQVPYSARLSAGSSAGTSAKRSDRAS